MAKETESCECSQLQVVGDSDLETDRTELHVAAIRGDASRVKYFIHQKETLVKQSDKDGNTVLHFAVKKNRLDIVDLMLKFHPDLCSLTNREKETPLCMAVRLGYCDIVKLLIDRRPDSIEILNMYGKNVLHLAVEFRRVKIVKFLTEEADLPEVVLRQLINQPTDEGTCKCKETKDEPDRAGEGTYKCKETKDEPDLLEKGGNTPLHIAANNKNLHMVELLLNVDGVDKSAFNKAGLTPLDIARETTEYLESYEIIEKLVDYPNGRRPFLYSAPTVNPKKHKKALKMLDKTFNDRRETELIVSVLLATIAFTAAFQVPGGLRSETHPHHALGSPLLIGYTSFKLFFIFDCVGFFVSFFISLMWTISSPISTDNPVLFMTMTGPVLCSAFAFMAYAFMCAVYAVVAHENSSMAWIILGFSIFVCFCGHLAFLYVLGKALVKLARLHRLCGVACVLDDIVEQVWVRAEQVGCLNFVRCCEERFTALFLTGIKKKRQSNNLSRIGGSPA